MLAFILYLWFNKSHQITKKSQTSDRRDFYSKSEISMNQRIEKYKFSQAFRDGSKAFIAFWIITFIAFAFLKGCADEQYANELKAKQNMYVRVQVEGAN